MANSAITALVQAGADAMSNMYEVYIQFPGAEGSQALTVRADGFDIPDVATATYQIEYHGQKIDKPATATEMERKFDLTFRLDAAYNLHEAFTQWHSLVANPNTGGVSNRSTNFGTVKVAFLKGEFTALNDDKYVSNLDDNGVIKAGDNSDASATRVYTFKDVWVSKVSQPKAKTKGSEAMTFQVTFHFGQTDYPGYTS